MTPFNNNLATPNALFAGGKGVTTGTPAPPPEIPAAAIRDTANEPIRDTSGTPLQSVSAP